MVSDGASSEVSDEATDSERISWVVAECYRYKKYRHLCPSPPRPPWAVPW